MAIYGATLFKSPKNETNFGYQIIGKKSTTFTAGDPVSINSNQGLLVYTTTTPIIGVIVKTQTTAATNESVELVKPAYMKVSEDDEFLMGTNAALTVTSVGYYFKLTGTTGVVQVDVTSGVQTGQDRVVMCTAVDPNNLSDLTQGLFKFVKIYSFRDND